MAWKSIPYFYFSSFSWQVEITSFPILLKDRYQVCMRQGTRTFWDISPFIQRKQKTYLIIDFAQGQVLGLPEARTKDILRHIPFNIEKAKNLPHHWFCSRTGIRFASGKDQCPRSSWQTHPNKLAPRHRPRHNNTKSSQRVTSVLWWFFVFKKVRRHLWRCDCVLRHGLFIP